MGLLPVRNLTLHALSEVQLELGRQAGVELQPAPLGVEAAAADEGLDRAIHSLYDRLRGCSRRGEGVLIGGYTPLWVAAAMKLRNEDIPLPTMYYFETARLRDAQDRFVFQPIALRRLDLSTTP